MFEKLRKLFRRKKIINWIIRYEIWRIEDSDTAYKCVVSRTLPDDKGRYEESRHHTIMRKEKVPTKIWEKIEGGEKVEFEDTVKIEV